MGLYKNFVSQTRKPEGVLGKMMVNGMNGGHAKMADWGLSHLTTIAPWLRRRKKRRGTSQKVSEF